MQDASRYLPVLGPWQWALVFVLTGLAALIQGSIGFGYAIFAVPLLSLIDARLAPVPQMLTALPLSVWAALRERGSIEWRSIAWIVGGRIPGVCVGAVLLSLSTQRVLDALIGAIVLSMVLLLSSNWRLVRSPAVDFAAGVCGAISGHVSGIGGPPIALLFRDAQGPSLRATLGVIFSFGVVVTLVGRSVTGHISTTDLVVALLLAPAMLLGMRLSRELHTKIAPGVLRIGVLATSALAALGLIGRACLG